MAAVARPKRCLLLLSVRFIFLLVQFRLVTVLGAKTEPFVSEESAHIRTLPYGSPSDAPRNLNVIVVDSTRISVSWDPPQSTNGALVAYVLQAREKGSEQPGLVKVNFLNCAKCLQCPQLKPRKRNAPQHFFLVQRFGPIRLPNE